MKRKTDNGKSKFESCEKILQAEKENLFSKYLHVPSALNYKGYPSKTHSLRDIAEMKDSATKDELEKMTTEGVIDDESESLKKATATKKVLCEDNLDETLEDFQESQIEKRQKLLKRQENPIFTCFVCQTDITHLDLNERAIHINECIDGQPSSAISSQETAIENTFILDCPLCFKHFPATEARCAHIKKCGKSRGLSTQSVIQAIRLQEKHVLERRALGLPLNNKQTKQSKKPAAKKFLMKPKSTMESDIHLAKALSLSLKENENKMQDNFDLAHSEDHQSAVLQAPSIFQNPGKFVSKKKALKPTPLLLLREEDERQKIILKKVNSIIASSIELKNDCVIENMKHSSDEQKKSFLWNLCGKAKDKRAYYVEQLIDWISPSNIEVGSKLCNLSQIAGHRIFTQLPCDYTFSSADKNDDAIPEDSESSSLIKSLRSLIGNCWMSDVDIHTVSGIVIPAHKLFLALRCPSLKSTFDNPVTSGRHVLHWENTTFDAALHFLNFIYTGSTEWKEDIIDELHQLAVKYEVQDLLNILDSNKETLEMLICEDSKENIEDSLEDMEILSKTNTKKNHSLNESNKSTSKDTETECQDANNGYFNDEGTCANSKSLDRDEQHTETEKDTTVIENIFSERDHVVKDKFSLNTSCTNEKVQICHLDLETDSNDSCQILNPESKTAFDKFQEEGINYLFSKTSHTSVAPTYCASPTKTLGEENNCAYEESLNAGSVLSPKLLPDASHKNMVNECNPLEISPVCTVKNNFLSRSSLHSFFEAEFKQESPKENSDSSLNFRNRKVDEAVIILENELNETEISKKNNQSFLKKNNDIIFSPPKASKLKSPSFNNSDVSLRSLSDQNMSNILKINCMDPYSKKCYVSPDVPRFSNCKENPSSCYVSSPKARPEITHYNKDNSFKKNLECHLNDCVYSMNSLSSPEILVCDSDNDMELTVENGYIPDKEYNSNNKIEVVLCSEDHETPPSNFNNNSSLSIKEKAIIPEIICCDSDDAADVTMELQSTQDVFNKSLELNKSNLVQCDRFADKNECTPFEIDTNNLVLDVIDCCSNSDDNIDIIEKFQSQNKAKEKTIQDDEYLDFLPLSERIEAAKSNTISCKAFEDTSQSSPESPWTFQTDKHCDSKPQEKNPKIVNNSACITQQNWDTTPSHLPSKGKYKNSTTVNKTEKNKSGMVVGLLQPKFKISDSPVTPLPDYKSMMTPDLKQALKRVGVKPLPRKKAVAVLSHIYNETHPWSHDEAGDNLESQSLPKNTNLKKNLSLPKKRKRTNEKSDQPSMKTTKSLPKTNHQPLSSENKTSSPDITSSPDESNNSRENFYNLSSDFSDSNQPDSNENLRNITQYILSSDELYKKVLTYSPLNLIEFQHELKENGLSISVQKLMEYLDEQCITFTCPRKEKYKKKQQVRTQRFRKRMIAKMSQQKSQN